MMIAAVTAAAVTLAATPVVRAAARRLHLLDHPVHRSSHARPTPSAGGLAILLGLGAGLAAVAGSWVGRPGAVSLLAGAVAMALLGLLDDRFDLPAGPRLVVQVAAAALPVATTGGLERLPLPAPLDAPLGPWGPAVSVFWIVAVLNLFNFMDGIDGLATLQTVITAGAVALALGHDPAILAIALAVTGSAVAFLPFNWAPASIFLGDVGSLLLGYALATLPLLAPDGRRAEAVVLVAASLFLFLADTSTCLVRRVVRGERWYAAHRQHLYQRWAATGTRHARVTSVLGLGSLATTGVALLGWWSEGPGWSWVALGVGVALVAAEWATVLRREGRGRPGESVSPPG